MTQEAAYYFLELARYIIIVPEFLTISQTADADPDWQTHENETPILLAARGGHHQCLRALINAQADFSMATNEGFTPLTEGRD